jgi:hypothetical protein
MLEPPTLAKDRMSRLLALRNKALKSHTSTTEQLLQLTCRTMAAKKIRYKNIFSLYCIIFNISYLYFCTSHQIG